MISSSVIAGLASQEKLTTLSMLASSSPKTAGGDVILGKYPKKLQSREMQHTEMRDCTSDITGGDGRG